MCLYFECVCVCVSQYANVCHMATIRNIDFHIAILRTPEAKGARHRKHGAIIGYARAHLHTRTHTHTGKGDSTHSKCADVM